MKKIQYLFALALSIAAGSAAATSIGNYGVTEGTTFGNNFGIANGTANLDDSGVLTINLQGSVDTGFGVTNYTALTTFWGATNNGIFTASSGTRTLLACSGVCAGTTLNEPTVLSLDGGGINVLYAHYLINYTTINAIYLFNGSGGPAINDVPVPAAAWLYGSGLLGLAGATRRKSKIA